MPSVKSYQNRKHEIEVLKVRVRVLEHSLNFEKSNAQQNLEAQKQNSSLELREVIGTRDKEIARLSKDLQIQKCQFDLTGVSYEQRILTLRQQISGYQYADKLNSSIIDAQTAKIRELERKARIYRDYIRTGKAFLSSSLGCEVPPPGWVCTRIPGHDGPCAAVPTIDIPSCLKPLDALKFVGKKITDGPDNLSQ